MAKRSLSIDDSGFTRFNELKVRIAVTNGSQIPSVMKMVSALIELGGIHYDELLALMASSEGESE
jgi:hypothetical protein